MVCCRIKPSYMEGKKNIFKLNYNFFIKHTKLKIHNHFFYLFIHVNHNYTQNHHPLQLNHIFHKSLLFAFNQAAVDWKQQLLLWSIFFVLALISTKNIWAAGGCIFNKALGPSLVRVACKVNGARESQCFGSCVENIEQIEHRAQHQAYRISVCAGAVKSCLGLVFRCGNTTIQSEWERESCKWGAFLDFLTSLWH